MRLLVFYFPSVPPSPQERLSRPHHHHHPHLRTPPHLATLYYGKIHEIQLMIIGDNNQSGERTTARSRLRLEKQIGR